MSLRPGFTADAGGRRAGLLVPLFALRGPRDWGIGEIGDVAALAAWAGGAGHDLLQLLPILELPAGERSPYGALSAFAIDPIFVSMAEVEDFVAAGGEAALAPAARACLERARAGPGIDYDAVRAAKRDALALAFARFLPEWRAGSVRGAALARFREAEAGWLADYALFRVCQERHAPGWGTWPAPLRAHAPEALAAVGAVADEACLFHAYVQWIAAEQWRAARRAAAVAGVRLAGDLPFMVSQGSADVWARQDEFALDASLGAPPDAFNADGQDWGLPVPRLEVMEPGGSAWLRARVRRAAACFDAIRLDHVVGFYRMYVRAGGGAAVFQPTEQAAQLACGERLVHVVLEAAGDATVTGEDLGSVPPWVRASLARLGVPGYCVLRWEQSAGVFRDPAAYPLRSVATSGTHDTSSLATWWEGELDDAARRALAAVPAFAPLASLGPAFTPAVHAALLDGLYAARSELVVVPFPDVYGGRERINTPAAVGAGNWGYRLPWTTAELRGAAGAPLRDRLRALARVHGRAA